MPTVEEIRRAAETMTPLEIKPIVSRDDLVTRTKKLIAEMESTPRPAAFIPDCSHHFYQSIETRVLALKLLKSILR